MDVRQTHSPAHENDHAADHGRFLGLPTERYWFPVAVLLTVGVGLPLIKGLTSTFSWWLAAAAAVTALFGLSVVQLGRSAQRSDRQIAALEAGSLRRSVEFLELAALPAWLRVAITHHEARGGRVDSVISGLRFASPEGDEIWTVPLPITDQFADGLNHRELHHRLGIDQNAYTRALLSA
jgi:hypothetical protein